MNFVSELINNRRKIVRDVACLSCIASLLKLKGERGLITNVLCLS